MSDTVQLWLEEAKMTHFAGSSLANTLYKLPVTVLLSGEVGAGKTTFLQGFADAIGVPGPITSPTYALEQRYSTQKGWEFIHIDLYRLKERQAQDLLESSAGHAGVRCIEWAERIPEFEDGPIIRILMLDKPGKDGRFCTVSFEDLLLPSRAEVENLRNEVMMPPHIMAHCDAVAAMACDLAKELQKKGALIRMNALRRSAELHDLLRFIDFREGASQTDWQPTNKHLDAWKPWKERFKGMKHEPACADLLIEKGYPELAEIVRVHGLTLPSPNRVTIEQQLLYYADKRMKLDQRVSLDERFEDFRQRYGKGDRSKEGDIWYAEAKEVERALFPEGVPL